MQIMLQVSQNYLNQHVQPMGPSVFGPPGQVFLYEWSKLRYGVFEEHGYPGDPLYPMFYSKQIFTADGPMSVYRANLCTNTYPSGAGVRLNLKTSLQRIKHSIINRGSGEHAWWRMHHQ